jgi:predicted nucleotidyltransferase
MNQQIFKEIRTLKQQLLPNEKVILFGSHARGEANQHSDWDLLVLLNKKGKITSEEDTLYGYPFDKIGWEFGIAINTLVYSTDDWEKRKITPFYKNIETEGIEIN